MWARSERRELSVSSNGSWWVKLNRKIEVSQNLLPFSILKRIVVGETKIRLYLLVLTLHSFSILKRIVVGETYYTRTHYDRQLRLSVSSNGSWWVKLYGVVDANGEYVLSVSSNGSWWVKPNYVVS